MCCVMLCCGVLCCAVLGCVALCCAFVRSVGWSVGLLVVCVCAEVRVFVLL